MSFVEIKPIRLAIDDPAGVIDIIEVANSAALPASPQPQTAYRTQDTGIYFQTPKLSGASYPDDWSVIELKIADSTLQTLYNQLGEAKAICRAFGLIARKLGNELRIIRNQTGSESTEYATASELYAYYKGLAEDCAAVNASDAGTSTGRYGTMKQPEIAGGNL